MRTGRFVETYSVSNCGSARCDVCLGTATSTVNELQQSTYRTSFSRIVSELVEQTDYISEHKFIYSLFNDAFSVIQTI